MSPTYLTLERQHRSSSLIYVRERPPDEDVELRNDAAELGVSGASSGDSKFPPQSSAAGSAGSTREPIFIGAQEMEPVTKAS